MNTITKVEGENLRQLEPQVIDRLLTGTTSRLMGYLRDYGYEDPTYRVETAVRNYLNSQKIHGGITLIFSDEELMPKRNPYTEIMLTAEDDVYLEWETDKYDGGRAAHILHACVQKNKEVLKDRENQKRWEKFCQRFADNKSVAPLLSEARKELDINKPVLVRQVPKKWWFSEYERETKPVVFLGQKPNLKTRSFVPSRPIGYVVDNKVCVAVSCTAPKEEKHHII